MEKMQLVVGNAWLLIALVIVLLVLSGCATRTEWYENGQVKSHREGFIEFSDGEGKNLPLSNISLIGK